MTEWCVPRTEQRSSRDPTEERTMGFRNLLRTSTFFNKLAAPPQDNGARPDLRQDDRRKAD